MISTIGTLTKRGAVRKWLLAVYRKLFRAFERAGVHVVPIHYSQPIPDTRTLGPRLWASPSAMVGLQLQEDKQLALLGELERFRHEYEALHDRPQTIAPNYRYVNEFFEAVDAEVLFAFVRLRRPRQILEIGSGSSTMIARAALRRNAAEGAKGAITCFDPHSNLQDDDLITVERKAAQQISFDRISSLERNDILFIDSSHIAEIGSDVVFEILELVPRVAPGVHVHLHDIFLPFEYPRDWVVDQLYFWNEQYLLQSFLAFNREFEVLWGGAYMAAQHPERVERAFPQFVPGTTRPGSFWFRRVG